MRAHSDALPIEAPGYVPWWPRPNVKLPDIMVQIVGETSRYAGPRTSCANNSTAE